MQDLYPLTPSIIEALYAEPQSLAEDMRAEFEQARRENVDKVADDLTRVALSCETMRATTRVMQCLAWLLNQRAHFKGEMSALQLRLHCPFAVPVPESDPDYRGRLSDRMVKIIRKSEHLYDRIMRLDHEWRPRPAGPGAIQRLREKLARAVADGQLPSAPTRQRPEDFGRIGMGESN